MIPFYLSPQRQQFLENSEFIKNLSADGGTVPGVKYRMIASKQAVDPIAFNAVHAFLTPSADQTFNYLDTLN
ncbi:hypothetical protein BGX30_003931 [Mortierella sp. GBA39]|nr:hypothetical protein BGX30_003931 [Mortierella sp. GBA39]